jgi:hypothetical protein
MAKAAGACGMVLVRADSAYYAGAVVSAARHAGAFFSITAQNTTSIQAAIAGIADQAWQAVRYPGAVEDPDTGELISAAEVADITYTAFAGSRHAYTGRLVVRQDKNSDDALFPVWRYHAFFTNTTLSTVDADLKHRQHAVIETVFADLIDAPARAPAFRALRRQRRLGRLRRPGPQPAPRRRQPHQLPRQTPRRNTAHKLREHAVALVFEHVGQYSSHGCRDGRTQQ